MDLRFRPRLDGLEDRSLLSVTPEQVVAAYTRTVENTIELRDLAESLGKARTTSTINFLATKLPQVADQSRADAQVLGEYRAELEAQLAANPALNPVIGQFTGGIGFAQFEAIVNAAYADLYAIGFGAPPPSPPPPPPVVDTPPNFGDGPDTGTDTSNPSALPFSLTAPEWQNLSGGLRFWDVTPGTGETVQAGDTITAQYTGYLTDGTVFDTTRDDNQPLTADLVSNQLIEGWVRGLPGVKVGGTRRLDIPADLAYGNQSRPGLPPNSRLIFEIQIVSKS